MMIDRILVVPAVAGMALLPVPADADERKAAEVECAPAGHRTLTYDCMFILKGRKSGMPIVDAEFTVGADMPSMPGAHNVRPVSAEPHDAPGTYRARIELEMTGEWNLRLDFTKPGRDRLNKKLHFGGMDGHDEPKNTSHGHSE